MEGQLLPHKKSEIQEEVSLGLDRSQGVSAMSQPELGYHGTLQCTVQRDWVLGWQAMACLGARHVTWGQLPLILSFVHFKLETVIPT